MIFDKSFPREVKHVQENNIPLACYEFLSAKTKDEQEQIYQILLGIDKYKKI